MCIAGLRVFLERGRDSTCKGSEAGVNLRWLGRSWNGGSGQKQGAVVWMIMDLIGSHTSIFGSRLVQPFRND